MLKHFFKETPITPELLIERLQKHFLSEDIDLLKRACAFARDHYANIDHPTGKSYIQYASEVALMLDELHADPVVIMAAIICPPPFVPQKVLEDLRLRFTGEIQELVDEIIHLGRLEWDIWSIASEQSELKGRREILQKMFLLAITEAKSKDQAQDSSMMIQFQKREKQVENIINPTCKFF